MKNKMIIGMMLALLLGGIAVPATAVVSKQGITKVVNLVKGTCDKIGNTTWNNKCAIAVGAATAVAVPAPEAVVQGATTVVTGNAPTTETSRPVARSFFGTILFNLCMIVLIVAGIRYYLHRIGIWKVLPLMIVALLLYSGVTEAGVLAERVVPMAEVPGITLTPWLEVLNLLLLIFTIFFWLSFSINGSKKGRSRSQWVKMLFAKTIF